MILVTGASGALGGLVAKKLAARDDVVFGTRTPRSAAERRIDFDDPSSLDLSGVDTVLMISAGFGEDDVVHARHDAFISAAEAAGVRHLVYTSLSGDGDHLAYALAHRWTERRLRASRLRWTVLRNGLYAEFLAMIAAPDADGVITAPLGEGRLAAVAREDLAEVAARVVTAPEEHAGRTYELVGTDSLGGGDLAAALGVTYLPGSLGAVRAAIGTPDGLPALQVPMVVGTYSAIAGGFLDGTGVAHNALPELLGREPESAIAAYTAALREVPRLTP
ncbi:NAD(P)H-binding protein [Streptomyces alkaliterrae]|uniref:NAD(P)H-binding protein n=1 Tax=Streptomyces alkaliterrae TaxID=2213162 RepID=A0A5P0YS74_9ACTN|nr:NAD(P)H-binding protein [Streptomyces alkaliterrae]MBB1255180.1 NAD(P)H-binding protein [Streptomyces alkaliterrae]MBB1261146.1 NAD(P)H-binding protein [Streptomyces alkaliterrae]MQS03174.1 NAD(P)H-binding protein [Streptomyces alkaliterrae]